MFGLWGSDKIDILEKKIAILCDLQGVKPLKNHDRFESLEQSLGMCIERMEKFHEERKQFIHELIDIATKASHGFFSYRLNSQFDSEAQKLVTVLNHMFERTEKGIEEVSKALIEFGNSNFAYKIGANDYKGNVGSMMAALASLGANASELLAIIEQSGTVLENSSSTLKDLSETLSTSSNEQASSLEQTAAAIEELTSNVSSNTHKATDMAKMAQETNHAVVIGNELAQKTAISMNEISEATSAINDAVAIIENIAFQTNILSLNAAVEAATAGDAGKGFAVVAQEVRNLANRSAEAAKQIKTLAESANGKAQEGTKTADEMIKGFGALTHKVTKTSEMIDDVASASREQMAGISQINDAVAQLDQMTQENARVSVEVSDLSSEIFSMSSHLVTTAQRTKYDTLAKTRVCDVDLIFDMASLKLDHVKFKDGNYKKLKENKTTWTVTDHHNCNLGKWIDAHKHETFAKSREWEELLRVHEHVHSGVQHYINADKKGDMQTEELMRIAQDIEHDTLKVFEQIDKLKAHKCH